MLKRKEGKEKPQKAIEKEEKPIPRSVKKRSQMRDKLLEAFEQASKLEKVFKAVEKGEYREEEVLPIAKIVETPEFFTDYQAMENGEDPIEAFQALLRITETFKAHIDF